MRILYKNNEEFVKKEEARNPQIPLNCAKWENFPSATESSVDLIIGFHASLAIRDLNIR